MEPTQSKLLITDRSSPLQFNSTAQEIFRWLMISRFRKELTIVPTVLVSMTKGGVSTTIRWDGRNRDVSLQRLGNHALSGPLPTDKYLIPGTLKEFGVGTIAPITSPGLESFKDLLIATHRRRKEISREIWKARLRLGLIRTLQLVGWASLILLAPSLRKKTGTALSTERGELDVLTQNLSATRISVNFDMESEIAEPHRRAHAAFERLMSCSRKWRVDTEQMINRVKARSSAGTVVTRVETVLARRAASLVDTNDPPPTFALFRGKGTAYLYPGFLLVNLGSDFSVVDITKLNVSSAEIRFTETEAVPGDSIMVGKAWAKSNKDGSRDRRFSHNRELPIMRYGELEIHDGDAITESFMFSDSQACTAFAAALNEVKEMLSRGRGSAKQIRPRANLLPGTNPL